MKQSLYILTVAAIGLIQWEKAIETISQRPPTIAINCQIRVSIDGERSGCHSESRRVQTRSELEKD